MFNLNSKRLKPADPQKAKPFFVELFSNDKRLPLHVRTKPIYCGNPYVDKEFKYVGFSSYKNINEVIRVRIFIDSRYVCDGEVTMSGSPEHHRRVNIPGGCCRGKSIVIEFAGDGDISGIEIGYNSTSKTVGDAV